MPVRILAGVAGRSLALMAGMVSGTVDSLNSRRAKILADRGVTGATPIQPVVLGVSGGAVGAAAAALGMSRTRLRQIAVDHPASEVVGNRSFHAMLTKRTLYPDARLRELAHAVVGDRTFADFVLEPNLARRQPSGIASSLIIPVYSGEHGTLFLPQDLPKLGLTDMPVADALVAATRIPGPSLPPPRSITSSMAEHTTVSRMRCSSLIPRSFSTSTALSRTTAAAGYFFHWPIRHCR